MDGLNWIEESRLEAEHKIEELQGRIAISGNTEKQLEEQQKELGSHEKATQSRITTSRNRLQGGDQGEFISDLTQHPSIVTSRKEKSPPRHPVDWELGN